MGHLPNSITLKAKLPWPESLKSDCWLQHIRVMDETRTGTLYVSLSQVQPGPVRLADEARLYSLQLPNNGFKTLL